MFIFIVFYQRYHLAARAVLQKRHTLVYKIYVFERCACGGYYSTKELELYFGDENSVHYLSIPPKPWGLLCRGRTILFHFVIVTSQPSSIDSSFQTPFITNCMIPATSPFLQSAKITWFKFIRCVPLMFLFMKRLYLEGGAVVQWLRYCATNRKVAGSIPDGVIGIFLLT